jgi:integrase
LSPNPGRTASPICPDLIYDRHNLDTNPLQHYKQGKKVRRKRILTDEELRAVWNAAGEIGGIFGAIVQLIMLTGQRRGEIAALG